MSKIVVKNKKAKFWREKNDTFGFSKSPNATLHH